MKMPWQSQAKPPSRTEGQRLLRKAVKGTSLAAIARAVGCRSRENCRCWLLGTKTPNAQSRAKLEEIYGVPRASWDTLPLNRTARRAADRATNLIEAVSPESLRPLGSTLEECLALLSDLRSYRLQPGLLPKALLRYTACETRVLALRARLEQDAELSEDRYVREHPGWLRLQAKILDVIRPYPEVMQKLLVALSPESAHTHP